MTKARVQRGTAVPSKSPAPGVARTRNVSDVIVYLSDGNKARVLPVPAALIDEVSNRIPEPPVPMWHNQDAGRDEPNPDDPAYLAALRDMNRKRGIAAIDAMVMFGVELVDGLPQDEAWLKKLRMLERLGRLDLSAYNIEDLFDKEFLYKRYVAVDNIVLGKISEISGITPADVEAAELPFQS